MPDLSKAVTFDLAEGQVRVDGTRPPQVLVGADALLVLAKAAGADAGAEMAHAIGAAIGSRAVARMHAQRVDSSVEGVVEHLGGELALVGFGSLGLERWGSAAVAVVDGSPFGGAGDALLEGVLAAALREATGRAVEVAFLGRDGARARFFLGGRAGADRMRAWMAEGVGWGEGLVRLHARGPGRGDA